MIMDKIISVILFCESRYPVNRKSIRKTIEAVLGERSISGSIEVSVSIVGDRKMRSLNKKYRGKLETTDVLSFSQVEGEISAKKLKNVSYPDGVLRLGDIVISFPQARKNAVKKEVLVDEEINFLIGHGLLHLLGIHHE